MGKKSTVGKRPLMPLKINGINVHVTILHIKRRKRWRVKLRRELTARQTSHTL